MSPVFRESYLYGELTDAEKAEQERRLADLRKPIEVRRAEALVAAVEPLLIALAELVEILEGPLDPGSDGNVLVRLSVGEVRTIVANAKALGWIAP